MDAPITRYARTVDGLSIASSTSGVWISPSLIPAIEDQWGTGRPATGSSPSSTALLGRGAAAQAIARNLEPFELRIRAGVHTGEVELRGDDVGGIAVHMAARVAAFAADGEIWVSATGPGLLVGSGLEFSDRGEFELKGVPRR